MKLHLFNCFLIDAKIAALTWKILCRTNQEAHEVSMVTFAAQTVKQAFRTGGNFVDHV